MSKSIEISFNPLKKRGTPRSNYAAESCGIETLAKKLKFLDLHQEEAKVQVKALAKNYKTDHFEHDLNFLKRGDIIGVKGFPAKTNSGELSIAAEDIKVLAPAQVVLPASRSENPDKRFRKRHSDLLISSESRWMFRTRSKIIQELRSYLLKRDFLEVETPILLGGDGVGGASANPFKTHHQDLEMDMLLRIAPELHLKMLVIGGFHRVFEIGRQFRNEGIDSSHNPEFTSCEFYEAFADYKDLMKTTEDLLANIVKGLEPPTDLDHLSHLYDQLSNASFARLEFLPALEQATKASFPKPEELNQQKGQVYEEVRGFLTRLCTENNLNLTGGADVEIPKLLDKLFSKLVEPNLTEPTFVLHHPMCMCPLAKESRDVNGVAERFELFFKGLELINAYTELNDPARQREEFLKQKQGRPSLSLFEEEFVNALEHGLPPTAGWGLGVDRLVMLLTGQKSLREVLLFPTVKPLINN